MNRTTKLAVATILAMAWCGNPLHADPPPQETQVTDVGKAVIADLDIPDGTTIEKALGLIKGQVPGFDYMSRKGRWQNQALPAIHVRNVTLGTALQLLINLSSGTFNINDVSPGNLFGSDSQRKRFFVASSPSTSADADVVQVFSLSAAIDRQCSLDGMRGLHGPASEARKRAMAAVLSLIENALKQSDSDMPRPELRVHDETETLVAHGAKGLVEEIGGVIRVLNRPANEEELHALKSENDELHRQLTRTLGESEAIKRRMDELKVERAIPDKK